MVYAFIVTLAAAIVFFSLYLQERKKCEDYSSECIHAVGKKYLSTDERDNIPSSQKFLTHELVKEAVRFNGYVPVDISENLVGFKVDGENYCITTDKLPIITIHKGYSLNSTDYNLDLMDDAASLVTDNCIVGRVAVDSDRTGISFDVGAVEYTYEHLCESLSCYIRIIQDLLQRHREIYWQLAEEQKSCAAPLISQGQTEGVQKILS